MLAAEPSVVECLLHAQAFMHQRMRRVPPKERNYGILQRPRVQSFLTDALERAGITPDALGKPILEALQARIRVTSNRLGTVMETELSDHQIRLQAYDRVIAAYGAVPRAVEMPEPPPPGLKVTINVVDPKAHAQPIKEVIPPSGRCRPLC